MKITRSTITTMFLLGATVILFIAIIYISISMNSGSNSITTVKKTKPAAITYGVTVTVGNQSIATTITDTPIPTETITQPSPTVTLNPTPDLLAQANSTITPTLDVTMPVATNSPTIEISVALIDTQSASPSGTKLSTLPETGRYEEPLAIVGIASFLIFVSFVI